MDDARDTRRFSRPRAAPARHWTLQPLPTCAWSGRVLLLESAPSYLCYVTTATTCACVPSYTAPLTPVPSDCGCFDLILI